MCDTSSPTWARSIGSTVVALEVALEAWNLNHWTIREVSLSLFFFKVILFKKKITIHLFWLH